MRSAMYPHGVGCLDVYLLFDIHQHCAETHADWLAAYGEVHPLTRRLGVLVAVTNQEITARNQWGRYNLYVNNPELFAKHRVLRWSA